MRVNRKEQKKGKLGRAHPRNVHHLVLEQSIFYRILRSETVLLCCSRDEVCWIREKLKKVSPGFLTYP